MTTPQLTQRFVHPSGLEVVWERVPHAPAVALQVWVRVGSADEREGEAGLAHVHEHMIFKGTATRGVGEVARAIESVGGSINAWTSFDQTVYHIVVPARHLEEGADVLLDAVYHSLFDPDELTRELEVIQEEIRRGEDMPSRVLSQALFGEVFRVHPYGRPIIGTRESVASFSREHVLAFFERWYRPENMTLVAVGPVDEVTLRALVDRFVGGHQHRMEARPERPMEPVQEQARAVVLRRDVQDAHLGLAFPTPALGHEDIAALDVLTLLLGGTESSLLFEELQRRRGLTQSVYAYLYSPADPGMMLLGARFQASDDVSATTVLEAMIREVAHLEHRFFDANAIERAKRLLESEAVYAAQTVQGRARHLGHFAVVAGDLRFEATYLERVRAVDAAALRGVARRWLAPERATVALLLPEAWPEEDLRPEAIRELVTRVFGEERRATEERLLPTADAEGVIRWVHESGLVVLFEEDPSAPLLTLRALVEGGSLVESAATAGLSSMTSELLTSGTHRRAASDIARDLDSLAASMGGISGRNALGLQMTALSRDAEPAMRLFFECLWQSTFPEAEVERIRRETLASIVAQRDQLAQEALRLLSEALFGDHPYGLPLAGTEATVSGFRREEIQEFARQTLRPERMVLSVVGDIRPAQLQALLDDLVPRSLAGDALGARAVLEVSPPAAPAQREALRQRQQAHVAVGWQVSSLYSDDQAALAVLASILGGQGGRLFLELRDRQSLAYTVSAWVQPGVDAGAFVFYIATSPEKLDQALAGIRAEVSKLQEALVTEEELGRAQRYLIGSRDISLQAQGTRGAYRAFDELFGLGYSHGRAYASRIDAVTREDIRAAARRYFLEAHEVVAVVRPEFGEAPAAAP